MKLKRPNFSLLISLFALTTIFISGCATVQPYDYTALNNKKPRSILVIPPLNNTVEVDAPYTYLSTISKPLAEKGYYVFPVAVIDTFLKENGLPTPVEMNAIPLDKIKEHIGADAVLYVTIEEWGQKYQVVSSNARVRANIKLIDTHDGELLWDSTVYAEQQSSNNGGGFVGALIGAIVDQIVGSIVDHTPQIARQGNFIAINNTKRGLLPGPYSPSTPKR